MAPTLTSSTAASEPGVTVLRKADGGTVYLLGTGHVSASASAQAASLVRRVQPSTVVLELCPGRSNLLHAARIKPAATATAAASTPPAQHTVSTVAGHMGDVFKDWTSLINMQYGALENSLDSPRAGGEFRSAAEEAGRFGALVVLGDRDVDTTRLRLKRLTPYHELLMMLLVDDPEWAEARGFERHAAAAALRRTSEELAEAVRKPHGEARDAELNALSSALRAHSDAATEAALPEYADAVINGLLRRFWCKELISAADKERLRDALDGIHRADQLGPMSPTMRRVLIDERDLVLCDALRRQPGDVVVGVVGKAHVAGIARLWEREEAEIAAELPAVLEVPRPPLAPLFTGVGVGVGLPLAAWRSQTVRRALGVGALAAAVATGWLVVALRDRLNYFEESQRKEASRIAAAASSASSN